MLNEVRTKQIAASIGIFIITFSLVAAIFVITNPKDNEIHKLVPISSISVEEPIIKRELTIFIINGWLPNSCWGYPDSYRLDMDLNTKVIDFYLRAVYKKSCFDIFGEPHEYHYNLSLVFLINGSWSMHFNGVPIEVIVYD